MDRGGARVQPVLLVRVAEGFRVHNLAPLADGVGDRGAGAVGGEICGERLLEPRDGDAQRAAVGQTQGGGGRRMLPLA